MTAQKISDRPHQVGQLSKVAHVLLRSAGKGFAVAGAHGSDLQAASRIGFRVQL